MPDLARLSVSNWLLVHGRNDPGLKDDPIRPAEAQPEVEAALIRLGTALDDALARDPVRLSAALREPPLRDGLRTMMGQIGLPRLFRLIAWIMEAGLPESDAVMAALVQPDGMPAVLSEMREGGRFAGLRSQFNADLALERGTAAAWEKMAGSLKQYGADRSAVAAIGARQNIAAALDARFEKLDAEIGKAASMIPSRHDGKSVMDDLGEKVREILDRAVNAIKSAFTPDAEKGARAAAAPSPAP